MFKFMAREGLLINIGANIEQLQQGLKKASESIKNFGSKISSIGADLSLGLSAPLAAIGASAIETTAKIDSLKRSIAFTSGSTMQAEKNFDFLRETSDKLGLSYEALLEGFKGVQAGLRGAGLSANKTNEIFLKLSRGFAGAGLSAADTQLAFGALTQIQAKGVVSLEELRGQLGERLPGALDIAAKSMGMTVAELTKLVSEGKVAANDFIPAFADGLEKTLGGAADSATNSLTARLTRLKNSFLQLQLTIGETIVPVVTKMINAFQKAVSAFQGLDKETKVQIASFAVLAVALPPILAIMGKLITLFGALTGAVSGFVGVAKTLPSAFKKLSGSFSSFTAVLSMPLVKIAALVASLYLLSVTLRSLYDTFEGFRNVVDRVANGFQMIIEDIETLWKLANENIKLSKILETLFPAFAIAKKGFETVNELVDDIGENKKVQEFGDNFKETVKKDLQVVTGLFDSFIQKLKELNPIASLFEGDGLGKITKEFKLPDVKLPRGGMSISEIKVDAKLFDLRAIREDLLKNLQQIDFETKEFGLAFEGLPEKIGELQNALIALRAAGLEGTPLFENVRNEIKLLKAELTELEMIESFKSEFSAMATTIGDAWGKAAAGLQTGSDAIKDTLKAVIGTLIDAAVKAVIAGVAVQNSFSGFATIGIALAAGAAAKAAFTNFAQGGIVSGETFARVGEYQGARSNPEVIAPLDKLKDLLDLGNNQNGGESVGVLRGEDIVVAFNRASQRLNFKYGL